MAAKSRIDYSPAKAKYSYQVKNWAVYDRALVNRKRPAVPPVVFHSVGAISGFLRGGGDGKKAR